MNYEALGAVAILFGFGLALAAYGVIIWGLIDAARRPQTQWQAARQSKATWIVVLAVVGFLGGPMLGWLGPLLYALIARPALNRAATASAPPYPPFPGYYPEQGADGR